MSGPLHPAWAEDPVNVVTEGNTCERGRLVASGSLSDDSQKARPARAVPNVALVIHEGEVHGSR
jgi:hypothetical protein